MFLFQDKDTGDVTEVPNVPGLAELVRKVKRICGFFHRSVNAADALKDYQIKHMGKTAGTVLKLIQEEPTRWNTKYFMFDRFLLLSEAVSWVLLTFPDGPEMLTGAELQSLQAICNVLFALLEATEAVSAEKTATASSVIPLVNMMRTVSIHHYFFYYFQF